MVMGRHGHATAQMADDEPSLLVGLAQLAGRLAAHGLLVQGVELAQPPELRKAGDMGHLRHLVHAHRVHEKGRDTDQITNAPGQICPQIGGMLAVGSLLHILHHPVADGVGAGGDRAVQAATAAHGIEILQAEAPLRPRLQHSPLAELRLIDDPVEALQLLSRVDDALFQKLPFLLKHRHLGGGGAGIDDQYLHPFPLSR